MFISQITAGYFESAGKYMYGYNKKYFLYVNRGQKKIYLVDKMLKVWKNFTVATGAVDGDKLFRGDNRTPSGVYRIVEINQYHEPWYIPQLKKMLEKYDKNSNAYIYYYNYYKKAVMKMKQGRKKIDSMNSVYLFASQGHKKFSTEEDLGYNAYGSAFMLLDYPNSMDMKKYGQAAASGLVPYDENGNLLPPGSGIAIHGTNDDPSLGYDASSGCVRMNNNDIVEVSNYVSEGTLVIID
jgi:murein L,D-transpeptidase YafK